MPWVVDVEDNDEGSHWKELCATKKLALEYAASMGCTAVSENERERDLYHEAIKLYRAKKYETCVELINDKSRNIYVSVNYWTVRKCRPKPTAR